MPSLGAAVAALLAGWIIDESENGADVESPLVSVIVPLFSVVFDHAERLPRSKSSQKSGAGDSDAQNPADASPASLASAPPSTVVVLPPHATRTAKKTRRMRR